MEIKDYTVTLQVNVVASSADAARAFAEKNISVVDRDASIIDIQAMTVRLAR
jgi:hypothetical protein